jgi:membrane protein implicated in regulation of membrane protease activity
VRDSAGGEDTPNRARRAPQPGWQPRLGLVRIAALILSIAAALLAVLAIWHTYGGHITATEIAVLSPIATFLAAVVALWVAGRDRRDRMQEREDEEKTHARLVALQVSQDTGRAAVIVEVRNFGPLPVLDVEVVDATWSEHREGPVGNAGHRVAGKGSPSEQHLSADPQAKPGPR